MNCIVGTRAMMKPENGVEVVWVQFGPETARRTILPEVIFKDWNLTVGLLIPPISGEGFAGTALDSNHPRALCIQVVAI